MSTHYDAKVLTTITFNKLDLRHLSLPKPLKYQTYFRLCISVLLRLSQVPSNVLVVVVQWILRVTHLYVLSKYKQDCPHLIKR